MLRSEIGRGFAFPLRLDRRGRFVLVEGRQDVEEAIRIILGTRPGERLMRGGFGSLVPSLLFEPRTAATAARVAAAIREALARWEPRIDVLHVDVQPDPGCETRMVASLSYRIRASNSVFNLVYPFYLQGRTEER